MDFIVSQSRSIATKADKKELDDFKQNMDEYKSRIGREVEELKKNNEIQFTTLRRIEKLLVYLVQKGGDDPTKINGLMG